MIINARQYAISERKLKGCLSLRRRSLHRINKALNASDTENEINDLRQEIDALQLQAELITKQMKEYIALSTGRIAPPDLSEITNLPNNIIRARIALGWSQQEFARQFKVAPSQVYRWESTQYKSVSLSRVLAIADLLQSALKQQD